MEAHARAPDPLTNVGDMTNNWKIWKEDFIIYMKVTGYIDKPDEIRVNLLKNRIGKIGIDAIQNMTFENLQDRNNMDILITKLEKFFNPPKSEVVERYQFFTRSKKQNESIELYINSLREKAETCNFGKMTDSLIRDKIILDTQDKGLRKKLLEADDLNLQKIIKIYNNHKNNTEKMRQFTKESKPRSGNSTTGKKGVCWRCGQSHPLGKCPAWKSKCTKCGDINHFTHCCQGPKLNTKRNDNNVNKNVLRPLQPTKLISKSSDSLWGHEVDTTDETMASVNKMSSLPDIPAPFRDIASSASETDSICDFILKNACDSSPRNSCYNNTVSQSAPSSKNKYAYSNANKVNLSPEWNTDLYKKDETTTLAQPATYLPRNIQYTYSNAYEAERKSVTDPHKKDETTKPPQSAAYLPRNTEYTYSNTYEAERKSVIGLHKKDETKKPAQSAAYLPRDTQYAYSNTNKVNLSPEWITDLYKKDETTTLAQPATYLPRNIQYTYSNAYEAERESVTDPHKKDETTKPAQSAAYLPRNTQYTYSNAYEAERKSVTDPHKKDETTKPAQSAAYLPRNTEYTYSNAYEAEGISVTDLHKKDETKPKTHLSNTYKKPKDGSKKIPFNIPKFKQSWNKRKDNDTCLLS